MASTPINPNSFHAQVDDRADTIDEGRRANPYGPARDLNAFGDETPLLARYVQIIWRRKWVIIGIIAAAVIAAILATVMATRLYTAAATIEIARQGENVVEVDSVQPEVAGADQEFYQTQYSLLESEALIDRVAEQLNLVNDTAFLDAFNITPADASLFENIDFNRLTAEQKEDIRAQVRDALAEHVAISPIRGSRIVGIAFTSPNPALSARIANAWVSAFIRSNFDRKLESTRFASEYLQERLDELRNRLEQSERDLVNYATSNRIITVGGGTNADGESAGQSTIVDANLSALNQSYAEARAARIAAQSRLQGGTTPEALNNATIAQLRERRAELNAEYANLLVTFEPEYPAARALNRQIDEIESAIAREESRIRSSLQTTFEEAQQRESRLQNVVSELEDENLDLRRAGIQYNIFQREVDTNRELYEALLQRFKEIGVASGIGPNNISIVDPARVPEDPSSPNLITNLLFGILAGLFGAAVAVILIEQIDRKIRTPADLERAVKLPVLGVIPVSTDDNALDAVSDRKSAVSEAYMSVQTALRLATDHGFPRTLMVTSTRSGEGKSLSSLALTRSLGRAGKKVILVEADLRSPSVHQELGFKNTHGTSDFLAGEDDYRKYLHRSDDNLFDAMSGGPVPPNPAELIVGERFDRLIALLREEYDHVIFDSPPVLGLADAPLIAEKVEGCVFVVEANAIGSNSVQSAVSRLSINARRIYGTILTKYSAGSSPFSYDYTYGYGYGETAPQQAI